MNELIKTQWKWAHNTGLYCRLCTIITLNCADRYRSLNVFYLWLVYHTIVSLFVFISTIDSIGIYMCRACGYYYTLCVEMLSVSFEIRWLFIVCVYIRIKFAVISKILQNIFIRIAYLVISFGVFFFFFRFLLIFCFCFDQF